MGIVRLASRAAYTLKNEGVNMFLLKTKTYISNRIYQKQCRQAPFAEKMFGDVLFINGCFLPHPSRYRISHQREQLLANGIMSEEILYTDIDEKYIKKYRTFIFYRCPYTHKIGKFIKKAKQFHKSVLFDIDDLVIDTKYTDNIPYLKTMSDEEKKQYDYSVNAMQKTLRMCDAAITTTEGLARELNNYVPEVYINRNVASDEMVKFSETAIFNRDVLPFLPEDRINTKWDRKRRDKRLQSMKKQEGSVRIGYFSGSITHNDDIEMILPVLSEIMKKYKQVQLYFAGELDIPPELEAYKDRIHTFPFVDWRELPELISDVDINISPLCDTVFNAAKSENKWMEAALVKVPTVASAVGAFKKMIKHGETGLLCSTGEEWLCALEKLIESKDCRRRIGENAYKFVGENCITLKTGMGICEFIKSKRAPNVAFVLPSMQISGGSQVVLKHCAVLKKSGIDAFIINDNIGDDNIKKDNEEINVISTRTCAFHGHIDLAVGTLWSTVTWVRSYLNISRRAYLVQGYETGFYRPGNFFQFSANQTYSLENIKYITVSKWCEKWLKEKFARTVTYIPNGLDRKLFYPQKRVFTGKIRILIEGNCDDYYKNVDESFKIAQLLDRDRYEIWFLSYLGDPKDWYKVDKFISKVPYEKVGDIYRKCHILLKSSLRESFSYPPLEMMSTGGYTVVRPNEGNAEYLRDGENCLIYDGNDLQTAADAIEKIASDPSVQQRLFEGGQKTAEERSWEKCRQRIVDVYLNSEEEI